jgi:ubiquinone/menaquinone biosynthesis C-methylase UbiE
MLDHGAEPRDEQQADALALPFEDQSFDAVFFPDKVQGYREAYRALRSGGHFFFNVWDETNSGLDQS